jgi:hypothetical protein
MRPLAAAFLLSLLAACYDDDDCDDCGGGGGTPVFFEQEPNDVPLTANDFGVLRPGDRFFIEGFVRDDPSDPFDGFAFVAGDAIHVDFQLFSGDLAADLDVCLYDPQLDQTLACFATDVNPERGGVDVDAGGFAFHLVVESFIGDADYSLEISVLPLFVALTAEDAATTGLRPHVRATDAQALRTPRAELGYRQARPTARPRVRLEEQLWIDERSGLVLSFQLLVR